MEVVRLDRDAAGIGPDLVGGDEAVVAKVSQFAIDIRKIDLARPGFMTPRHVRNVDQSYFADILFELLDQIAFRDLLMKEVVQELHSRMVHLADNLEPLGHRRKVILRILLRIDVF